MSTLLDWIFPLDCVFCGKVDFLARKIGICRACFLRPHLIKNESDYCNRCKSMLQEGVCMYCNEKNIFFEELFFIRYRDEQEKEVIRHIKFAYSPWLSGYFALCLGKIIQKIKEKDIKYIMHVPSSMQTFVNRPYFSSGAVLQKVLKRSKAKLIAPLEKVSLELQSGKTYFERFLHAHTSFCLKPEFEGFLDGTVLVVDDVFTTGASVNEISRILLAAGVEKVYILILAKNRELTDKLKKTNLDNH